jgi:UDP-galactopyranose mutase
VNNPDLIVVGAGFYGCTVAEHASSMGFKTIVIDRRDHIGGNAYSEIHPETGIEIHKYGPHIFHTSNQKVVDYLTRFTDWTPFLNRVYSVSQGKVYSLPINLHTISQFVGKALSPKEAREWVRANSDVQGVEDNLETKAISLVGRPLYEALIKGYTEKQWQTSPTKLPSSIISRLAVRYSYDNNYYNSMFQAMPADGYTAIFSRMLSRSNIEIRTGVDWKTVRHEFSHLPTVYSGPIDEYFDYRFGALGWRTVDFQWETHLGDYQGNLCVNYADLGVPYTRIAEYKHAYPRRNYGNKTVIAKEFSRFAGEGDEPYYPINTLEDQTLLQKYQTLCAGEPNVHFGGRLATYQYLDMHQAVSLAMRDYSQKVLPMLTK